MTTATADKPTTKPYRFRGDPAKGIAAGETRVDREKGIIYGYSVATIGEAKGHNKLLDAKTLEQIVELGNKSAAGIKARFGHPGLSSDGVGKFVGRSKNFRLDGDRARADLHISETAYDTPHGDLGTYVLDLAEKDPDAFGSSIVFQGKDEAQLDENGKQLRDGDGKPLKPFVRVTRLSASDIVDDPAANDGLFEAGGIDFDSLPDAEARQATEILDRLFGAADPAEIRERVGSFLNRYLGNKEAGMAADNKPAGDPTPDPKPADGTPAPVTFTAEQLAAKEREAAAQAAAAAQLAEKTRTSEIVSLCNKAKHPELAAGFITEGLSVADVQTKLFNQLCTDNPAVGDGGGSSGDPKPADEDAKFKAEYAADAKRLKARGVSEADYVFSRRVDCGLEELRPNSYPKLAG